jgi:hypothetical protein
VTSKGPIAADNPGSFIDDTPTAKLVRQVLGAISEFDKAMTVAKLRGARERKRREAGKCEGRKSHAERNPELVALAKRLHRHKPKGAHVAAGDLGRAGGPGLPQAREQDRPCLALGARGRASAISPNGTLWNMDRCPPLLRLDVDRPNHLAPFLGFVGDELAEIGR